MAKCELVPLCWGKLGIVLLLLGIALCLRRFKKLKVMKVTITSAFESQVSIIYHADAKLGVYRLQTIVRDVISCPGLLIRVFTIILRLL